MKLIRRLLGYNKHESQEINPSQNNQALGHNEIQLGQTNVTSYGQVGQNESLKDHQKTNHSQYREDIDGLRTIAIGIALIFHGFPQFMPGGFVGVDVFFVISGYLISGIIIKQVNKGKFSILDFYERRVKRIYPALLLVMTFSLALAYKAYLYKQLKTVTKTLAASSIFSANIQIMVHKQDDFDAGQKENAFLHLWSLGVQEQFYIIWPWLISILLRRLKSAFTLFLSIFTITSFVFGIYFVYDYPKIAFYFPFARFWQMSIGGILAYKNIKIINKKFNDFLSIMGTVWILTVIWFVNEKSNFPGFWALIPTFSSAFILTAGPNGVINKFILSSRIFVFIGKISYPLYLWHWPLMVFSRKLFPAGSTSIFGNMYFIVFLSFVFSILTYYFVQNKIRFRKQKKVVLILLMMMLILGVYSTIVAFLDGRPLITAKQISPDQPFYETDSEYVRMLKAFQKGMIPTQDDYVIKNGRKNPNSSKNPKRQSTSVEKLKAPRQYFELYEDMPPKKYILDKKIDSSSKYYQDFVPKEIGLFQVSNEGQQNDLFIVGDSHARMLSVRLQYLYEQSKKRNESDKFPTLVSLCHSAHAYLLNSAPNAGPIQIYREYTPFFQRYFKQYKPKRILSVNRWLGYWKDCFMGCPQGQKSFTKNHIPMIKSQIDEFAGLMKELVDLGMEVTVATLHMDDDRLDSKKMYDASGVISQRIQPLKYSEFRQKYSEVIEYFEGSLKKVGVKLIDIADNFCWEDTCQVLVPTGYPAYLDYNHFSLVYSRYWASSVDHLVDF